MVSCHDQEANIFYLFFTSAGPGGLGGLFPGLGGGQGGGGGGGFPSAPGFGQPGGQGFAGVPALGGGIPGLRR